MTDCSCAGAGEGDGSGARYEQIVFSFGEDVKPTLKFDAAAVTVDAGLAPLRELDERLGLTALAAASIDDLRRPGMVVHPVDRLLRETMYAYAAGYEDANDHTPLSADVWFRELVGATNGGSVNPKRHDGLASDPTISRLLGGRKLGLDRLGSVHLEWFARLVENAPPDVVTLDIDGYDAETYGMQQLSLFNGYYREKMYYPLLVTVAEYGFVVAAKLRPGSAWSGADAVPLLRPVLERLQELLPNTRIRLRADSGFRPGASCAGPTSGALTRPGPQALRPRPSGRAEQPKEPDLRPPRRIRRRIRDSPAFESGPRQALRRAPRPEVREDARARTGPAMCRLPRDHIRREVVGEEATHRSQDAERTGEGARGALCDRDELPKRQAQGLGVL